MVKKSIGLISWPKDADDAVRLLLRYMSNVVVRLGISFGASVFDPLPIIGRIQSGKHVDEERRAALVHWWNVVDREGIRNLQDKDVLNARLAICLLSPSQEEYLSLGEQLSWFLEVLGFLGADVDEAIDAMEEHFDFL
jgi:hypothetical protein